MIMRNPTTLEKNAILALKQGKVGVFPSDTLYGLTASVFVPQVVDKVQKLKKREAKKSFIILFSRWDELDELGLDTRGSIGLKIREIWDFERNGEYRPTSVVIPLKDEFWGKFEYLHQSRKSLALRKIGKNVHDGLVWRVLQEVGPVISTTVNLAGEEPAKSIWQAKEMFGKRVNFYFNIGKLDAKPSRLIKFSKDGQMWVLR